MSFVTVLLASLLWSFTVVNFACIRSAPKTVSIQLYIAIFRNKYSVGVYGHTMVQSCNTISMSKENIVFIMQLQFIPISFCLRRQFPFFQKISIYFKWNARNCNIQMFTFAFMRIGNYFFEFNAIERIFHCCHQQGNVLIKQ